VGKSCLEGNHHTLCHWGLQGEHIVNSTHLDSKKRDPQESLSNSRKGKGRSKVLIKNAKFHPPTVRQLGGLTGNQARVG